MKKWKGQTVSVLAEEVSKNDSRMLSGRTVENHLVHFTAPQCLIGQTVDVVIDQTTAFYMIGHLRDEVAE